MRWVVFYVSTCMLFFPHLVVVCMWFYLWTYTRSFKWLQSNENLIWQIQINLTVIPTTALMRVWMQFRKKIRTTFFYKSSAYRVIWWRFALRWWQVDVEKTHPTPFQYCWIGSKDWIRMSIQKERSSNKLSDDNLTWISIISLRFK